MAEGILFNIAEGIMKSLDSLLAAKEFRLLLGAEDELRRLNSTVSTIKDVLPGAEERQPRSQEVSLLGVLSDILYEADDLLDAVSTEALRYAIMTQDTKAKKVRIFFFKLKQLAFCRKMGRKIKVVETRLYAFASERPFDSDRRHEETRDGYRANSSFLGLLDIVGRENDKKAVIEHLNANVEEDVLILSIIGIGGLGKTTLARLIYNDEEFTKQFDLKIWVCVTENFNIRIIVQQLLECITLRAQEDVGKDKLASSLREEINGKKYLLVLDDVWNEDPETWSHLKILLMGGGKGSRILVTTRSSNVAEIMTAKPYQLHGLDEHASWKLFRYFAFGGKKEPKNPGMVEMGRGILKKCAGVPLAVRTVGAMLYSKDLEFWVEAAGRELATTSQGDGIMGVLKLSYDRLSFYLKHCFAYCSLFPKDYRFNRLTLINLWIAQGFVQSKRNQCLEDVGSEFFLDLFYRSFFQEIEMDENGDISHCKMHDLMHDLAISVAQQLSGRYRHWNEKARHIAFDRDIYFPSIEMMTPQNASILRTFLCPALPSISVNCKFDWEATISSFKVLRVLDLSLGNLEYVPSSIGNLRHLRYLNLSYKKINELPHFVTWLLNLEVLILNHCSWLEILPRDIARLVNLRHLDLARCGLLRSLPKDIAKLAKLKHLDLRGCLKLMYVPIELRRLPYLQIFVDEGFFCRHRGGLNQFNGPNNRRMIRS